MQEQACATSAAPPGMQPKGGVAAAVADGVAAQAAHSSTEPVIKEESGPGRKSLLSGHRRLSNCSESLIEAIEVSSSFGTASPGASSTAVPEETPAAVSASPVLSEGASARRREVSATSTARSGSRRRDVSLLELTPGEEGYLSTSTSDASQELMLSPRDEEDQILSQVSQPGEKQLEQSKGRSGRRSASPLLARRGQPGCMLPCSPEPAAAGCTQNAALLLRMVESLQAEKAALDERLHTVLASHETERQRLETDNARLRAANLEKDRQLAHLLGSVSANCTSTRESIGGCSRRESIGGCSSLLQVTGCSPLVGASP